MEKALETKQSFISQLSDKLSINKKNYSLEEINNVFYFISSLLSKSIMDFSIIKNFIFICKRELSKNSELISKEICTLLSKEIRSIKKEMKQQLQLVNYYHLIEFFNFVILLIINLESKPLIKVLFKQGSDFEYQFFRAAKRSLVYKDQHDVVKVLYNFFSYEFVNLFNSLGCMEEYNYIKNKIIKYSLRDQAKVLFNQKDYSDLIRYISEMDFNYSKLFEDEICENQDKHLSKK
jgi:hypothetical protein